MRILNVNVSIDSVYGGGTGERTVQMSVQLAERGHSVTLLTIDLGITATRKMELKKVKLVVLPCLMKRFFLFSPFIFLISRLVKDADIVHIVGHWTLLNVLVYLCCRWNNIKYVVCPAGALPIFGRSRVMKKIFNIIIGKRLIVKANAHIAVARDEVSHFKEYGVKEESIIWIPNGIAPETLAAKNDDAFREKFNLGSSPFILFMGRLNPIKGPDLLLGAFVQLDESFSDFHLVFAGPDEGMLADLRRFAQDNQVEDRVHFLGHISGEIKSWAYHAASLMVIPSRSEAMSIVVLEAGAVKLPVLFTDRCGLNELADISAGVMVSADIGSLLDGLRHLLSSPQRCHELGMNLHAHVQENYLWTSVVNKFEQLYQQLGYAPV